MLVRGTSPSSPSTSSALVIEMQRLSTHWTTILTDIEYGTQSTPASPIRGIHTSKEVREELAVRSPLLDARPLFPEWTVPNRPFPGIMPRTTEESSTPCPMNHDPKTRAPRISTRTS